MRDLVSKLPALSLLFLLLLPRAALASSWTDLLQQRLEAIDARLGGGLGVYVYEAGSDESFSFRADESWYLASGTKVPVAIAVLRQVDAGALALDTRVRLEACDYVDGAGPTSSHRSGTMLGVDYLLEQMLTQSDNTATDALIRVVGLPRVNAVAEELLGRGTRITTLADVRRHAYSALHPRAFALTSRDLLALHRTAPQDRVTLFSRLVGVSPGELGLHDLDSAFERYYATQLNAAPLRAYGQMLFAVTRGRLLSASSTAYLLSAMTRAKTGRKRLKAGFPKGARFAHKTGTQRKRICDLGIVSVTPLKEVVVAACVRGAPLSASEDALRDVGLALSGSGLFGSDDPARSPGGGDHGTPYARGDLKLDSSRRVPGPGTLPRGAPALLEPSSARRDR